MKEVEIVTKVSMYQTHKAYFEQLKNVGDIIEIKHGKQSEVRTNIIRYMKSGESKFHLCTKSKNDSFFVFAEDFIDNWKGYKNVSKN